MKLYRTRGGVIAEEWGRAFALGVEWDELFRAADPAARALEEFARAGKAGEGAAIDEQQLLAPIGSQEVWAAGVTYYRSRDARMEESKTAAGGDSRWNVPEPELTLAVNAAGRIFGVTIGNDMSSRDIEGENPLYLPQAKVYDGSCALGPCILLSASPPSKTAIQLEIARQGKTVFKGNTTLAELKREPKELAKFLFRENSFPQGVFLMTGTGIVPKDDFTLTSGDAIRISIDGIGTLENYV